jgi:hypothetical protein
MGVWFLVRRHERVNRGHPMTVQTAYSSKWNPNPEVNFSDLEAYRSLRQI